MTAPALPGKKTGMGIGRRHFLGLGGAVLGGTQPALGAAVNAARLTTEGRAARLALTLEGPMSWEWRALAEPPRLVLSLPGVAWHHLCVHEGALKMRLKRVDLLHADQPLPAVEFYL